MIQHGQKEISTTHVKRERVNANPKPYPAKQRFNQVEGGYKCAHTAINMMQGIQPQFVFDLCTRKEQEGGMSDSKCESLSPQLYHSISITPATTLSMVPLIVE